MPGTGDPATDKTTGLHPRELGSYGMLESPDKLTRGFVIETPSHKTINDEVTGRAVGMATLGGGYEQVKRRLMFTCQACDHQMEEHSGQLEWYVQRP